MTQTKSNPIVHCGISGIPLLEGEECWSVPIVRNPYAPASQFPTSEWYPVSPPMKSYIKYNGVFPDLDDMGTLFNGVEPKYYNEYCHIDKSIYEYILTNADLNRNLFTREYLEQKVDDFKSLMPLDFEDFIKVTEAEKTCWTGMPSSCWIGGDSFHIFQPFALAEEWNDLVTTRFVDLGVLNYRMASLGLVFSPSHPVMVWDSKTPKLQKAYLNLMKKVLNEKSS